MDACERHEEVSTPLVPQDVSPPQQRVNMTQQRAVVQLGALGTLGSKKDVNVFESSLELALDRFRPAKFEQNLVHLETVTSKLSQALKASTHRELDAKTTMVRGNSSDVGYTIRLISTAASHPKDVRLVNVTVEHITGTMRGQLNKLDNNDPTDDAWEVLEDFYDLEVLVGKAIKNPRIFSIILAFASPLEIK